MRIAATSTEGVTFLEVSGEVDLSTAHELQDAGIRALTPITGTLRIDLAGVTFMDSTGLSALIAIRNAAASTTTVVVQNPQQQVRRIFEITGLDTVFDGRSTRLTA